MHKSYLNFKKAAHYGSVNAKYNLGSLYLTGETIKTTKSESGEKVEFSFS